MVSLIAKWLIRSVLALTFGGGMVGCTQLSLNYASLETSSRPALQPLLDAGFDRANTKALFETELYGPWPANLPYSAAQPRMIDKDYLDGRATLSEIMVTIGEGTSARTFPVVLALPKSAGKTPVPLIISQTFADNCSVFPNRAITALDGGICDGPRMSGIFGFLVTQVFGTYIALAPTERYIDAGFGYASFEGSGFVPDRNQRAQAVMQTLSPGPAPTSTLASWAFAYGAVAELLGTDARIRPDAAIAFGHSRFGKSALIAAAWSDQIKGAIAHQSGFAGAASSRSKTGERLNRMTKSYPHWLRPGLGKDLEAGKALSLDQHFLLALAAPKPIFLGNGRRDVWSDPNSTFQAALAADTIYEQAGGTGLPDGGMRHFDPAAQISYYLREGGHSIVSEDIDAFIAFASAHFAPALEN